MGEKSDFRLRLYRGYADLLDAAEGHLRGEDWDKEMLEAIMEIKNARASLTKVTAPWLADI